MNQPLKKGRLAFIAEKYQSSNGEAKNRYATIGRATAWSNQNGGEDISIEIDTLPVGVHGSLKTFIFWDEPQQQQAPQQQPVGSGGQFGQHRG